MRENKFRIWDKQQNQMIMPGDIPIGKDGFTISLELDGGLRVTHRKYTEYVEAGNRFIPLQSTGQRDKNGKEDWIDDIVEVKVGPRIYRRRIFQSETSGAYCINLPVIGATSGQEAIMLCTIEHTNIGNVHDNPGLIEEVKE